jgi:hypothetical protein
MPFPRTFATLALAGLSVGAASSAAAAAPAARANAAHRWADPSCCPILELRQYTLKPGQRDVLIDLFEREFVESQEALGMRLVGQFRDLDRPERFVWIRGFADMPARAEALGAFYGGPVWQAHREAANATMIDSDNVLLLRPADANAGFASPETARAPAGAAETPPSRILATIYSLDHPVDDDFRRFFDTHVEPAQVEAGARPIARLETEPAENTFPRLPVRENEHVFVSFAAFADDAALREYESELAASPRWGRQVLPELLHRLRTPPEVLRLAPTARSQLR